MMDNPPTIIIVVSPKSNSQWKATRERIIHVLDRFNLHMVAVEILKGAVEISGATLANLSRTIVQGHAQFGGPMGIPGTQHSSSTLMGS